MLKSTSGISFNSNLKYTYIVLSRIQLQYDQDICIHHDKIYLLKIIYSWIWLNNLYYLVEIYLNLK